MGKRSDFQRRPMDDYRTIDPRAIPPLVPFLDGVRTFAEPCCGGLDLVRMLEDAGLSCVYYSDIKRGHDALEAKGFHEPDAIITNPPWTREILHPMIRHFQSIAPTWLLFDADWHYTKQSAPFLPQCSHIVAVGRLKWIPDSKFTGKDNCAWYRFDAAHREGPRFYGHPIEVAA